MQGGSRGVVLRLPARPLGRRQKVSIGGKIAEKKIEESFSLEADDPWEKKGGSGSKSAHRV